MRLSLFPTNQHETSSDQADRPRCRKSTPSFPLTSISNHPRSGMRETKSDPRNDSVHEPLFLSLRWLWRVLSVVDKTRWDKASLLSYILFTTLRDQAFSFAFGSCSSLSLNLSAQYVFNLLSGVVVGSHLIFPCPACPLRAAGSGFLDRVHEQSVSSLHRLPRSFANMVVSPSVSSPSDPTNPTTSEGPM